MEAANELRLYLNVKVETTSGDDLTNCTCASFFTVRGVHKKDCPCRKQALDDLTAFSEKHEVPNADIEGIIENIKKLFPEASTSYSINDSRVKVESDLIHVLRSRLQTLVEQARQQEQEAAKPMIHDRSYKAGAEALRGELRERVEKSRIANDGFELEGGQLPPPDVLHEMRRDMEQFKDGWESAITEVLKLLDQH